jgi:hypothetical protein
VEEKAQATVLKNPFARKTNVHARIVTPRWLIIAPLGKDVSI